MSVDRNTDMIRFEKGFGDSTPIFTHKINMNVPNFAKNKEYFDIIETNIDRLADETATEAKPTHADILGKKDFVDNTMFNKETNLT